MLMTIPESIDNEEALEQFLASPYPETVEMMRDLEGDIMILGGGGKMGPSLAQLAFTACCEARVNKKIFSVDLFPDEEVRKKIRTSGIETIRCDLLNIDEVRTLPKVKNIIFMAGRKFGEIGSETLTWMINVIVPSNVMSTFKDSNIVAFSTGCVYALVAPESGGSVETDLPAPLGEYANSCLGRERIFQYYSEKFKIPILLFRLNYAIDCRYGVLVDIAQRVYNGRPVDLSVNAVNFVWQGDANNRALLCLKHTSIPPAILNVTGGETLSVESIAKKFAQLFGVEVKFTGHKAGKSYLSNANQSIKLFGPPRISSQTMIRWIADWIKRGGKSLGKPTHFEVTDGQFLSQS